MRLIFDHSARFTASSTLRTIFKKIQLFQFYLHILKINEFWQRKISFNWAQIWHIGISLCAKQSTKREIRNSKKSHFSPTLMGVERRKGKLVKAAKGNRGIKARKEREREEGERKG